MKEQLTLFTLPAASASAFEEEQSLLLGDGTTSTVARIALERYYKGLLIDTQSFNRRVVSYQANKKTPLHQWFKYKEGFSAQLVDELVEQFELRRGSHILDPFAGSATTLLVAKQHGLNATGIELLPHCHLAWNAKSRVASYDLDRLRTILKQGLW